MKKILVVEDEQNIRKNLVDILEISGYSANSAENGIDALMLLKDAHYDLILSDIRMPIMDGTELLMNIKQIDRLKNIPFLFLTAKTESEDFRHGMNLGADDYVTKPFKYVELLKAIEVRLGKRDDLVLDVLVKAKELADNAKGSRNKLLKDELVKLTKTEKLVLAELAKSILTSKISADLHLSQSTIKNHRYNMIKRLGFKAQNSLLRFAVECQNAGLLQPTKKDSK